MEKVDIIRKLMRPFIAFCLVLTGAYLVIIGKINPEMFWGTVVMIIGFYFGERSALKTPGKENIN